MPPCLLAKSNSSFQAMIKSAELRSTQRDTRLGAIQGCVVGVVFMGTPHRGSGKADLGLIASSVAKAVYARPNRGLVQSLKKGSHILEQQRDSFVSVSERTPIACLYEEKPMKTGGMVRMPFTQTKPGYGITDNPRLFPNIRLAWTASM